MSNVVKPTAGDVAHAAAFVEVRDMPGKGRGVVARRDIPAWTLVGPYPGVRYTMTEYDQRHSAGKTTAKFVVDYWKSDRLGRINTRYVIDPGDGAGGVLPAFAAAVAPLVNEPPPGEAPNLVWVWNFARRRIEFWTAVPVRRGQELTVCYGTEGNYPRTYKTSCTRRGVEPYLHVITSRWQTRPEIYYDK